MVNVEISAADLPDLWEEYIWENGAPTCYVLRIDSDLQFIIDLVTTWLFGDDKQ